MHLGICTDVEEHHFEEHKSFSNWRGSQVHVYLCSLLEIITIFSDERIYQDKQDGFCAKYDSLSTKEQLVEICL